MKILSDFNKIVSKLSAFGGTSRAKMSADRINNSNLFACSAALTELPQDETPTLCEGPKYALTRFPVHQPASRYKHNAVSFHFVLDPLRVIGSSPACGKPLPAQNLPTLVRWLCGVPTPGAHAHDQEYWMFSRILQATVVVVMLFLFVGAHPAEVAGQSQNGRIAGTVTGPGGTPLDGIEVNLYVQVPSENSPQSLWQLTQVGQTREGAYEFTNLPAGAYRLKFHDQYSVHAIQFYPGVSRFEDAFTINLTADETVQNINAQLQLRGAIAGRVTNDRGEPIVFMGVFAYRYVLEPTTGELLLLYEQQTMTDEQGYYQLCCLNLDSYLLRFDGSFNHPFYMAGYYDNVLTAAEATPVVVLEDTTTVVNFKVANASRITGRVTNLENEPLPNMSVRLYRFLDDQLGWHFGETTTTNQEGDYTLEGISPGVYRVEFFHDALGPEHINQFYANADTIETATDITVPISATIAGINAQLKPTAAITGTVRNQQGESLASMQVRAWVHVSTPEYTGLAIVLETMSDEQGRYKLAGLEPAAYLVEVSDAGLPGIYESVYYPHGRTVEEATWITVTESIVTPNIDFALRKLGEIHGRVTDEAGNPLSDIRIEVARKAGEYWEGVSQAFWIVTDSNGQYQVRGLPGGRYRVDFSDSRIPVFYVNETYDNIPVGGTPTEIVLEEYATVTGIDAQLTAKGQITGTVTTGTGEPIPQVSVTAYQRVVAGENIMWLNINEGDPNRQTDEAGSYRVSGLDAGIYRLSFHHVLSPPQYATEFYHDAQSLETAKDIEVALNTTVTNINIQLAATARIRGRVTDEQGVGVGSLLVHPYRLRPSGPPSEYSSWELQNGSYTNEAGEYELVGLMPGIYRIHFDHVNDWEFKPQRYATEYYDNVATLLDAVDISVTAGSTVSRIDAQLSRPGEITGIVRDESNHPLGNVSVQLYRQVPWLLSYLPLDSTLTDETGAYRFERVNTGTYRIGFSGNDQNSYQFEYYNNAPSLEDGTDIVLGIGESASGIDAELFRNGRVVGRVTDASGAPLSGVAVTPYRYVRHEDGSEEWVRESHLSNYIDFYGNYTLFQLPAGRYRIGFEQGGYLSEFYDNAWLEIDATELTIRSGSVYSDINASLETAYPADAPPRTRPDRLSLDEAGSATQLTGDATSVLHNDTSWHSLPLTAQPVTPPTHGALTLNPDGRFVYTHDGSESTSDWFTYQAGDGVRTSTPTTVTITISPTNDAPVAGDDRLRVTRGGSTGVLAGGVTSLLANDNDAEAMPLNAQLVTPPAHGTATIDANGIFTYTHDGSEAAADSFTYQASDGQSTSVPATVTVAVDPVAAFTFHKTVGIDGIYPRCTAKGEMKVPVNTTVIYCYTLHNTGGVTLTRHTLVDSHLGVILADAEHLLAPNATYSTTVTQTLTISTTNIATWTASLAGAVTAAELTLPAHRTTANTAATITISAATDDQDGDTIPDNVEGAGDPDSDNLLSFLDDNADGDALPDQQEAGANPQQPQDSNGNGTPDFLERTAQPGPEEFQLYFPLIAR
jgi:VCBS repeat-containing protein